jgi:hypothetical protein
MHYLIRLSCAILLGAAAWGQQFKISTFAGTGTKGFTGDGGAATAAELFLPGRVVLDSSGHLFIADGGNNRIRQISGGNITTIAGDGTAAYKGDGGAATSAELNDPTGIALDSSGNLYIADSVSNRVLKVSAGTVTVLAGNTSANFAVTTSSVAVATNVHISGSYNGNMQGALMVNPASLISKAGWSVTADSQETSCYNGAAANAIDGNPSTMWVTQFCSGSPAPPHEIRINLGASHLLSALQYLPRQDGCSYGWIRQYEIYVSNDGVNWGTPVATGSFNYGNLATGCPGAGVPAALQVNFTPVSGQYIRLRALSEINSHPWITAAEINVIGCTVDEATGRVQRYLEDAALGGLTQVRIIHGKGTGRLRRGIAEFLKTHPLVAGFHLASFEEGGAGATIVDLETGEGGESRPQGPAPQQMRTA